MGYTHQDENGEWVTEVDPNMPGGDEADTFMDPDWQVDLDSGGSLPATEGLPDWTDLLGGDEDPSGGVGDWAEDVAGGLDDLLGGGDEPEETSWLDEVAIEVPEDDTMDYMYEQN